MPRRAQASSRTARCARPDGRRPRRKPAELLELDLDSLERIKHPLLHTPLCPACREHIEAPAPPVLPGPTTKPADLSPALSAVRMERALDPLTGIYAGVHVVAHDTTEPVSGQFTAWVTGGTDTRRFSPVRSGATGSATKRSEVSARVCAIGEGLERYSAGIYDRARFIRGSFDALGPMALDPRTLPLGSAAEYAAGAAGTPAPFAPDRELDWVVGGELATGRHRLVPAAAVYLPYRAPGPGERLLHPISTGWAAGSSLARALRGGLLEVVERDAAAVFWLNRLRVPTVDWRQLPPGPARTQLDRMADQGIDVLVKDVTTDLGIPSVIALARFDTGAGPAALCGFRADVDDQACILGAVQELGQIVSAYLQPSPRAATPPRPETCACCGLTPPTTATPTGSACSTSWRKARCAPLSPHPPTGRSRTTRQPRGGSCGASPRLTTSPSPWTRHRSTSRSAG